MSEIKDVAGGYYEHRSLTPPTICPKCGKQLTRHPRTRDINNSIENSKNLGGFIHEK